MHRIEEEDRNKVYEVLKELYSTDGKETKCFEVCYVKDEVEYYVYRMVTKFVNSVDIIDFMYDKGYQGDEDSKSRPVIQKWTLDIPKEMMEKAIEVYDGEDNVINNFAIVKLFNDAKIDGAERLGKWFIRHLEIDALLDKYDEINGTAKPKVKKSHEDETVLAEAENSEYHGGTYDV